HSFILLVQNIHPMAPPQLSNANESLYISIMSTFHD
ncbi:hypothetical protein TSMEX_009363, partial [Taenia solium]